MQWFVCNGELGNWWSTSQQQTEAIMQLEILQCGEVCFHTHCSHTSSLFYRPGECGGTPQMIQQNLATHETRLVFKAADKESVKPN
jgi:hypothetical protein